VTSPPSTATVPVTQAGGLTVVKSALPPVITAAGQLVSYSFVVTNTGNVTLTNVAVADLQAAPAASLASGPACPAATLAPGATETCTATYTVTQADIDNGSVSDSATVSGDPPSGPPVTSPPSTVTIPVVVPTPTGTATVTPTPPGPTPPSTAPPAPVPPIIRTPVPVTG
jgi:hypothetical protein